MHKEEQYFTCRYLQTYVIQGNSSKGKKHSGSMNTVVKNNSA